MHRKRSWWTQKEYNHKTSRQINLVYCDSSCHVIAKSVYAIAERSRNRISNCWSRHAISMRHLRIVVSETVQVALLFPCWFQAHLPRRNACRLIADRTSLFFCEVGRFSRRAKRSLLARRKKKKWSDPVISGTGKQFPFGPAARSLGRI